MFDEDLFSRRDDEVDPHHIYIYISKDLFLAATKSNFLVTIDTVIFLLNSPYRFSDNKKI